MFKTVKTSTTTTIQLNAFSTVLSDNFLLKYAPRKPPMVAAVIIIITTEKSKSENPLVTATVVSFEICERRIVIKEQIVAVLVGKEKR